MNRTTAARLAELHRRLSATHQEIAEVYRDEAEGKPRRKRTAKFEAVEPARPEIMEEVRRKLAKKGLR